MWLVNYIAQIFSRPTPNYGVTVKQNQTKVEVVVFTALNDIRNKNGYELNLKYLHQIHL